MDIYRGYDDPPGFFKKPLAGVLYVIEFMVFFFSKEDPDCSFSLPPRLMRDFYEI